MIQKNINLKQSSSFYIGGNAEFYAEISNQNSLLEAINFAKDNNLNITTLGMSSNVIIPDEGIKGLVIKFSSKDITKLDENNDYIILQASAGIIWDDFVKYCVENNFYGVENLSYIPGSVGACAVQNIGAYGQEAAQSIQYVKVYDTQNNTFININNQDCNFSYRKSIFNSSDYKRYIITDVVFKLQKQAELILGYQDLRDFREEDNVSLKSLRQKIIQVRQQKLPDYNKLPNVGSFFKNIVVSKEKFDQILIAANRLSPQKTEKLKSFKQNDDSFKIPTALLIEICGLKGFRQGNVAIYDKHALIVVNYNKKASAKDVKNFAEYVIGEVYNKLGVKISIEPTFL